MINLFRIKLLKGSQLLLILVMVFLGVFIGQKSQAAIPLSKAYFDQKAAARAVKDAGVNKTKAETALEKCKEEQHVIKANIEGEISQLQVKRSQAETRCLGQDSKLTLGSGDVKTGSGAACAVALKDELDDIDRQIALKVGEMNAVCSAETAKFNSAKDAENEALQKKKDADTAAEKENWTTTLAATTKIALRSASYIINKKINTWIVSGGKGQTALYSTKGVKNTLIEAGDTALGTVIDQINETMGIDFCSPDFNARLSILYSLNYTNPIKPKCTYRKLVNNWKEAIQDANFSVSYRGGLKQGETDFGIYLSAHDQLFRQTSKNNAITYLEYIIGNGYKSVTDSAGNVKTPSSLTEFQTWYAQQKSDMGSETWTGTWIDIFKDAAMDLIMQLIQQYGSGYFSVKSSDSNRNSIDVDGIISDSESSPNSSGIEGAENYYNKIYQMRVQTGGVYDVLLKLGSCADINNPGPTDCVIDQSLLDAIADEKQVYELSAEIKNRPFINKANKGDKNPNTSFTLRNIKILRKYRIAAVGWEIAAEIINEESGTSNYSLQDLLDNFNNKDSKFYKLVDPYWVLKAPELFCRRVGYGPDMSTDPNDISRPSGYCADEQQCIKESDDGKCQAYGYCTEEKRAWNFNGEQCQPLFNTCQTYTARTGQAVSYLKNTLDFRDCDRSVVGCQWLSADFNETDGIWTHVAEEKTLQKCAQDSGCLVTAAGLKVDYGRQVSSSTNGYNYKLILPSICSELSGCSYPTASCTVPKNGVRCAYGTSCVTGGNVLLGLNYNFNLCSADKISYWSTEYSDAINKHVCVTGGRTNNAFRAVTDDNQTEIKSGLKNISVSSGGKYTFNFYAKGTVKSGAVTVEAWIGSNVVGEVELNSGSIKNIWKNYSFDFTAEGGDRLELVVKNKVRTIADVYLDDFELLALEKDCIPEQVWLTLGIQENKNSEIYFDRDVQSCQESEGGCSQFIRNKPGLGSNLLFNGEFENVDRDNILLGWRKYIASPSPDPLEYAIYPTKVRTHSGSLSIGLNGGADNYAIHSYATAGININDLRPYKKYILSAWIWISEDAPDDVDTWLSFVSAKTANDLASENYNEGAIGYGAHIAKADSNIREEWQRISTVIDNINNPEQLFFVTTIARSDKIGGMVFVDDVKLEQVSYAVEAPSEFTPYDPSQRPTTQLAYLKKAPAYYNCYKTTSDKWPTNEAELINVLKNQSVSCANYAGVCTVEEVGCEYYDPINDDPSVPATITANDLCPAECVGYQVYRQSQTAFTNSRYTQFIANSTTKSCSASYAGCDEFTNLDTVAKGGEGIEYYAQLRSCEKPGGTGDATYYTWEGSDTTGYQLKTYNLKKSDSASAAPAAPCTSLFYYQKDQSNKGENYCLDLKNGDSRLTGLIKNAIIASGQGSLADYLVYLRNNQIKDSTILNQALVNDLNLFGICVPQQLHGYFYYDNKNTDDTTDDIFIGIKANTDCREFYDGAGNISYRLLSKTTLVAENCYPYRRSDVSGSDNPAVSCPALAVGGSTLVVSTNECDCVSTGGYWNEQNQCVYMAISGGGTTCPVSAAGCREYSGNKANNVRQVLSADFNSGTSGFTGGSLSTEASYPGNTSFKATSIMKKSVSLQNNKSYIISFWAKGETTYSLRAVKFSGAQNTSDYFAVSSVASGDLTLSAVSIGTEWKYYELGPVFMDWSKSGTQDLEIDAGGKVLFIDNILLKEVQDQVYVIANSWYTPASCDNSLFDPTGSDCGGTSSNPTRCLSGAMLGCNSYVNSSGQQYNLRSFSHLCRPEAVGCEELLDTYNSNSPFAGKFNQPDGDTNNQDDISVPADSWVYLVNNHDFQCAASDKGCTVYGQPVITAHDEVVNYQTVAYKNQPDRYSVDLCRSENLWCEEYSFGASTSYFKNPRSKLCQYNTTNGKWQIVSTGESCESSDYQTIGYGVAADKEQPIGPFDNFRNSLNRDYEGFVGICPTDQSGCSEYIDPTTSIYTNLLFNGDWQQDIDKSKPGPDGWTHITNGNEFNIKLSFNTLYSLSLEREQGGVTDDIVKISCDNATIWSPDNSVGVIGVIKKAAGNANIIAGRVYLISNNSATSAANCTVAASGTNLEGSIKEVKLTDAGVYYYLNNAKIDKTSCRGQVDFRTGCVLFNDRSGVGYADFSSERNYNYLLFNASQTYWNNISNNSAVAPDATIKPYDSSAVIKVKSDRQCRTWLYCSTYDKSTEDQYSFFNNTDRCLDLSLCTAIGDKGECKSLALDSSYSNFNYDTGSDINKTGYAKLLSNKNTSGVSLNSYQLMDQIGGSTDIPNGGFESTALGEEGEDIQPLAWYVYNTTTKTYGAWTSNAFVVREDNGAVDGSSFLQLNGGYATMSDIIDVKPNTEYFLSVWVNTGSLRPLPDPNDIEHNTYSQVEIIGLNKNIIEIANGTIIDANDQKNLLVNAGDPAWKLVAIRFKTASTVYKLKVLLSNKTSLTTSNKVSCEHEDGVASCSVLGHSLFDNVSIKPFLQAGVYRQDGVDESLTLPRECRLYPNGSSLACSYLQNNNLYYGWQGYCLLKDPDNSNICLQWWPIDKIMGDEIDEMSAYKDRVPLYYCLEQYPDALEFFSVNVGTISDGIVQVGGGPLKIPHKSLAEGKERIIDLRSMGIVIFDGNRATSFDYLVSLFNSTGVKKATADNSNDGESEEVEVYNKGTGTSLKVSISDKEVHFTEGGQPASAELYVRYAGTEEWVYARAEGSYTEFNYDFASKIQTQHVLVDGLKIKCRGDQGSSDTCDLNNFEIRNYIKFSDGDGICNFLVKAANEFGSAKPWTQRILPGSKFNFRTYNPSWPTLVYNSDYKPFGSAVFSGEPENIDGDSVEPGRQPLSIEQPNLDMSSPYQARAGIPYPVYDKSSSDNILKYIEQFIDHSFVPPFIVGHCSDNNTRICVSDYTGLQMIEPWNCSEDGVCEVDICQISDPLTTSTISSSINPKYTAEGHTSYDCSSYDSLGSLIKSSANYGQFYFKLVTTAPYEQRDIINRLFVQTYGVWKWDTQLNRYIRDDASGRNWSEPELCAGDTRPSYSIGTSNDICAIRPKIYNIGLSNLDITGVGTMNLKFNILIDDNQLPLKSYTVNWGDGSVLSISGANLTDRSTADSVISVYHFYDYWRVLANNNTACLNGSCAINIAITATDNWGAEVSGSIKATIKEK